MTEERNLQEHGHRNDAATRHGARTHSGDGKSSASEAAAWTRDYEAWRRGRLDRVQASAQVWLTVLTTILGLLGSIALVKGGTLVSGVTTSGWFQIVLGGLVVVFFGSAVLAVIAAGVATWGGLRDIAPTDESEAAVAIIPQQAPAGQAPAGQETVRQPMERWRAWWQRLAWWALRAVLAAAGVPKGGREQALPALLLERGGGKDEKKSQPAQTWLLYRDDIVQNANRNRIFLHASRFLGVIAAAAIAGVAIVAVVAGTVYPAPSYVIIVKQGKVSCGPVGSFEREAGVSQVIPVGGC